MKLVGFYLGDKYSSAEIEVPGLGKIGLKGVSTAEIEEMVTRHVFGIVRQKLAEDLDVINAAPMPKETGSEHG